MLLWGFCCGNKAQLVSVSPVGGHSCCVQLWAVWVPALGMWLGMVLLLARMLAFIGGTTEGACVVFHSYKRWKWCLLHVLLNTGHFSGFLVILGMYSVTLFGFEISFSWGIIGSENCIGFIGNLNTCFCKLPIQIFCLLFGNLIPLSYWPVEVLSAF